MNSPVDLWRKEALSALILYTGDNIVTLMRQQIMTRPGRYPSWVMRDAEIYAWDDALPQIFGGLEHLRAVRGDVARKRWVAWYYGDRYTEADAAVDGFAAEWRNMVDWSDDVDEQDLQMFINCLADGYLALVDAKEEP